MSFITELKRRNVFRVGMAYAAGAWIIVQLTDALGDILDLPAWGGKAILTVLLIGLPIALLLAWAFEVTPDGIKKENEVDRSQSITSNTARKLDRVVIILLAVALSYFVFDEFVIEPRTATTASLQTGTATTDPEAAAARRSIAVLPLADMSPEGDHEYFSDGLTEELLNILSRINNLQVAGRTSAFAFKGKNEDLRTIGQKLNVEHILEGSVRKDEANNRVRITLQLIDTKDGYHLWSETYDRDLVDIFKIQEDVAHDVAKALRITLLGEDEARLEQVAATPLDAYDLYLRGRQEHLKNGYANLQDAESLYEEVLILDPDYLPARLALAEVWIDMAFTGALSVENAAERALPVLDQVLEQAPENSSAFRFLGNIYGLMGDDDLAHENYQRAIALEPLVAANLNQYGSFLLTRNSPEQGMELITAALELEPYNPDVLWENCKAASLMTEADQAAATCERLQEAAADSPMGFYGEARMWTLTGELGKAIYHFDMAIDRDPEDFEMLAWVGVLWLALGDAEQADRMLVRAQALGAGQPFPIMLRMAIYNDTERYGEATALGFLAREQGLPDRHGTNGIMLNMMSRNLLRDGELDKALTLYREKLPWLFETPLIMPAEAGWQVDDMLSAAIVLQRYDPLSERAREIADLAGTSVDLIPFGWPAYVPHFRRAAINLLRGDKNSALSNLEQLAQKGVDPFWREALLFNPQFDVLKQEDRFQALIRTVEDQAEAQRQEAYSLLEQKT